MAIIIGIGVESGSALVPDVACISMDSRKLAALPLMFIGMDISDRWAVAQALMPSSRTMHRAYMKFLPDQENRLTTDPGPQQWDGRGE